MFGFGKKKTGIYFDILPNKSISITVKVTGGDGPLMLAKMINLIFSRDPDIINTVIGAVKYCSDKDGWSNQGTDVANEIFDVQSSIDNMDRVTTRRNPIVKPSQVLSNINKKISQGGE
jgi:hypothetical protein